MKRFHDTIWKEIIVDDLALQLIDTVEFQRLHYIKQTGLLYKVFQTASHTRFQHSLGTYHVTRLFLSKLQENSIQELDISERTKQLISIAALCHDIGHGPFSHMFDELLSCQENVKIPKKHEERSCVIFRDMVQKYNISINQEEVAFVCSCIANPNPCHWFELIVNNSVCHLDVDKIDSLLRDSYHIGLSCNFEITRILNNIMIHDQKLVLCDKIKYDITNLFRMRRELHENIYRHQVVEKFQAFLLENLIQNGFQVDSMEHFLNLSDYSILMTMNPIQRIQFETRSWFDFSTEINVHYKDEQQQEAEKRIVWFRRKELFK